MDSILVTGGAGYIGSHVVLELAEQGAKIVVLDNLSTGFARMVIGAQLVVGDVNNIELVSNLLREHRVGTVVHLAARTNVLASVDNPLLYYAENSCATHTLLSCCARAGVARFILSSTAAVYGAPADGVATEETPTLPINPYGTSKLMAEWMLRDYASASRMQYVILRYFNVAGCDARGRIGQLARDATLLIKVACEVAVGKRGHLAVYGTQLGTPDGTGIRDYVHVSDLARAHVDALAYLKTDGASVVLNCGYGRGHSVLEIVRAVESASGVAIPMVEAARRPGDAIKLIADARKIKRVLGWAPRHDNIESIVADALSWESSQGAAAGLAPWTESRG